MKYISGYQKILAIPAVLAITALGVVMRIPLWAQAVVFTMHIRYTLGRSFTEAGLAIALMSVSVAIAGPWRGRVLDRSGLRVALVPCLMVYGALWLAMPWLPYWWLVAAAVVAGLFYPPHIPITRAGLIAATDPDDKKTVLALDSAFMELSFVIGPALGVWAALAFGSRTTLFTTTMSAVLSLAVLAWWNPPTSRANPVDATSQQSGTPAQVASSPGVKSSPAKSKTSRVSPEPRPKLMWNSHLVTLLILCVLMSGLLGATDISVIAGNEHFDSLHLAGWGLGVWAVGSMISSLIYGAANWKPPFALLAAALAVATLPMALAVDGWTLLGLLFVAGIPCGPAIVASIDSLTDATDPSTHGQAMGTHSACMQVGGGLGAPLAGYILERGAWWDGVAVVALAVIAMSVIARYCERRQTA